MYAILLALAQVATPSTGWAGGPTPVAARSWPTREQNVVLSNFRLRDGETLPQARMHVTTLGNPHRNAAGEIGAA